MRILFKRLTETAIIPSQKRNTDAGIDFYADRDVTVPAGGSAVVHTGIAWDGLHLIAERHEPDYKQFYNNYKAMLLLKSRSGLAFKSGIECTNAGVIDESYTEEIMIKLYNHSDTDFEVRQGDRIAQGVFLFAPILRCEETETIVPSGRGGFGASGMRD